jgi:hypothetical protein
VFYDDEPLGATKKLKKLILKSTWKINNLECNGWYGKIKLWLIASRISPTAVVALESEVVVRLGLGLFWMR